MFIGKLLFIIVALMAFWMLIFLGGCVPVWIGAYFKDLKDAKKEAKASK
jgi:hypothetical protein